MLISKAVQVRWVGNTKKHYVEKGYEFTKMYDYFECKIEDLMTTSTVKVEVKCDYCEDTISTKPYRDYLRSKETIAKDCCRKRFCMVKKSEESNLIYYGVKNINSTVESINKKSENLRTPKEEVLNFAKSKDIEILNIDDYENDRTRLNIICNNHMDAGVQETNFANIKKNKHCCQQIRKTSMKRIDGNQVIQEFIDHGLVPMFKPEEYVSSNTPMPYTCPSHLDAGIQHRCRDSVFISVGCGECVNERRASAYRSSPDKVLKYFTDRNISPVDLTQYSNRTSEMKFICPMHPNYIQTTRLDILRNTKVPCAYCREDNSLSSLNRKIRSSIGKWRKSSEKACEYSCILTGSLDYEVHHLYTYNNIILDAMKNLKIDKRAKYSAEEIKAIRKEVILKHEELLGVCIHPALHIEFHKIYSKDNNTPEQFEEFKKRYETGEFEELLNERID